MGEFLKSSSFKVLVITVVVLLGLLIYTASAGGSFLASLLGFVSAPMQGVATQVTENVTEFVDLDGLSKSELKTLVSDLQDEKARLQSQLVDYERALQENEQLKVQLQITQAQPENKSVAATVIGRDPNDVFGGFTIDKGTLDGLSAGDPVITVRGLVGVVTQANATTSKVTTLFSEGVKVSAACVKKRETGVISSDIITANSGLLRMEFLSADTRLEEGDIITTSGAGGAYPKYLGIGTVKSVEKAESNVSKYAVVEPMEDFSDVTDVFVIVSFPGKGDAAGAEEITDPETVSGEDTE